MKDKELIQDIQTREMWVRMRENRLDAIVATWSGIYLLLMMALFFWLLFDIWIGRHYWAHLVGYERTEALNSPTFRLMAYTVIGGGLGGGSSTDFVAWNTGTVKSTLSQAVFSGSTLSCHFKGSLWRSLCMPLSVEV